MVNISPKLIGVSTNLRVSLGKLRKYPFGLDPLKKSEYSK